MSAVSSCVSSLVVIKCILSFSHSFLFQCLFVFFFFFFFFFFFVFFFFFYGNSLCNSLHLRCQICLLDRIISSWIWLMHWVSFEGGIPEDKKRLGSCLGMKPLGVSGSLFIFIVCYFVCYGVDCLFFVL